MGFQAHLVQSVDGDAPRLGAGFSLIFQRDRHLLQGGQGGKQVEALKDEAAVIEAETINLAGLAAPKILAQGVDLAIIRFEQAR